VCKQSWNLLKDKAVHKRLFYAFQNFYFNSLTFNNQYARTFGLHEHSINLCLKRAFFKRCSENVRECEFHGDIVKKESLCKISNKLLVWNPLTGLNCLTY